MKYNKGFAPIAIFAIIIAILAVGGGYYLIKNKKVEYKNFKQNQQKDIIEETNNLLNNINKDKNNNTNTVKKQEDLNNTENSDSETGMASALRPSIVYKTKKDYSNNVSIGYKNGEIVSYPGPSDAVHQRPVSLANGYLLKAMTGNVFLGTTITELVNTGNDGDWNKFMVISNIIDYHPFTEVYDCKPGVDVDYLNQIILSGKLKTECKDITNTYNSN